MLTGMWLPKCLKWIENQIFLAARLRCQPIKVTCFLKFSANKLQWNPAITKTLFEKQLKAWQNYSKICGHEPPYNKIPTTTNRFWRSQCTIYPAVTNILSSRSQQSVKTTYLSRNHSLLYSGFDKYVHCTIVVLNFCFSVLARLP